MICVACGHGDTARVRMHDRRLIGSEQRGRCPMTCNAIYIRVWGRAIVANWGSLLDFGRACLMSFIPFPDVVPTPARFLVHDIPNDAN